MCVVVDGFCVDVAFTSGESEWLHTTGLRFGVLVTMSFEFDIANKYSYSLKMTHVSRNM